MSHSTTLSFHPGLASATLVLALGACSPDANEIGGSSATDSDAGTTEASTAGPTAGSGTTAATASSTSTSESSTTTGDDGGSSSGSAETSSSTSTGGDSGNETGGPETGAVTVFVNFEGGDIVAAGADDAAANMSSIAAGIAGLAGPHPAYGAGPKRDAVLDAVRQDFSGYSVAVTDARPDSGDYVMIMVGPSNALTPGLATAPLDCGDLNPRNIGFVDASVNDALDAETIAAAISRQAATTFGMERTDVMGDIMGPLAGTDFVDQCGRVQNISCAAVAADACAGIDERNSHQELLVRWGSD